VTRLKDVAILNRQALPENTDAERLFRYVDIGSVDNVGRITDAEELRFEAAPSRARRLVQPGDSIVSTVRTYLRAIAHMESNCDDLVVSTGFTTLSPRPSVHPRFLFWTMQGSAFIEDVVARSVGVSYPAITATELGIVPVPQPTLGEQRRIADYLDAETARIDELIAEQLSLAELLWERRRAAVFDAVTGRLVVGNRRCGVPWVDSIPAGWSFSKLTNVARLGSGHTPARDRPDLWVNCTIPWITTGEVSQIRSDVQETLVETREKISALGVAQSSATVHPAGTVVLCRTAASAGFSAIMGKDMATSQDFATWTCGPDIEPSFLLYCLRAMRADLLGRLAMGSTHRTIYMPEVKSIAVPLPPIAEQRRLVAELRRTFESLDKTRNELTRQIDLLRERRQALITTAVTEGIDCLPGVA
jgi:type I restriction enzyme, S subunit